MKEKPTFNELCEDLAKTLVTPERFFTSPVVHELPRLALLPSLPDNVFLAKNKPETPEAS